MLSMAARMAGSLRAVSLVINTVFSCVDFLSVQHRGAVGNPPGGSIYPHSLAQVFIGLAVIVCISILASDPTITSQAQDSGSDSAPLGLGEGDGAGIQG
jgi:hypothetical protein